MSIQTTNRRAIICLGAIYLISLCLPALYSRGGPGFMGGGNSTFWGFMCLGFLPVVMMVPFWWANPLFYAGLVCLALGRYLAALVLGIIASLLALATIVMVLDDLRPQPGRVPIFPLGPGYFAWIGSIIGLAVVSFWKLVRTPPADHYSS
jgi:hypothetical protein